MSLHPFSHLHCPLCQAPLQRQERQWRCPQHHSFDLARQGYLNLLPVQHKQSRDPGDSQAMVQARRDFLQRGFYQPIAEALAGEVMAQFPGEAALSLLDAGCGEGYYLDFLLQRMNAANPVREIHAVGLDISKPAVIAACKRRQDVTWLVASNRRPPLAPASLDGILCLFGFPIYESFAPLLKAGGKILLVDPGPDHLIELRRVIYPQVRETRLAPLEAAEAQGFRLLNSNSLHRQTETLDSAAIADLLAMTPHLYRAPREGREAAAKLTRISLTMDVVIRTLEHRAT